MKTTLIRGVPLAIQRDGWWFSGPPPHSSRRQGSAVAKANGNARLLLLAALLALGDVLVWQVVPGLSLALFGAVMIAASLIASSRRFAPRQISLIAGVGTLILLPLIDLVQPLSLLIAVVGVSVVLAIIAGLHPSQLALGAVRLWPAGLAQTLRDGRGILNASPCEDPGNRIYTAALGWLMPIGLGSLFVLLFAQANPIVLSWIDGGIDIELPPTGRLVFWVLLTPIVWTAMSAGRMTERLGAPHLRRSTPFGPHREGFLNARSVRRALMLFNAMFAVQTGMDALFLYGGVDLPEGISYAEYAHRGAYPLLLTALLAGAFALLTRAWTHHDATLRIWLMVWVAQNVALVISSLVRLDLYVGVYGLTHLRIHAAIWMALVAFGLGLVIWQVRQGHPNRWLMLRCSGLGATVLYVSAFISFDAAVARYNTSHPVPHDAFHLCNLGDAAQPYVELEIIHLGKQFCPSGRHYVQAPKDWREWGFRNWRARRSLAVIQAEADT